jgi:hypothetical protein
MHIFTTLTCLLAPRAAYKITFRVVDAAITDGIDLYSLSFAAEAPVSIQDIYDIGNISIPSAVKTSWMSTRTMYLHGTAPPRPLLRDFQCGDRKCHSCTSNRCNVCNNMTRMYDYTCINSGRNVQCSVFIVHCSLFIVHCSLFIVQYCVVKETSRENPE